MGMLHDNRVAVGHRLAIADILQKPGRSPQTRGAVCVSRTSPNQTRGKSEPRDEAVTALLAHPGPQRSPRSANARAPLTAPKAGGCNRSRHSHASLPGGRRADVTGVARALLAQGVSSPALRFGGLSSCLCSNATPAARSALVARVVGEVRERHPDRHEKLGLLLFGAGQLGTEASLVLALVNEGYSDIHVHLVDQLYPDMDAPAPRFSETQGPAVKRLEDYYARQCRGRTPPQFWSGAVGRLRGPTEKSPPDGLQHGDLRFALDPASAVAVQAAMERARYASYFDAFRERINDAMASRRRNHEGYAGKLKLQTYPSSRAYVQRCQQSTQNAADVFLMIDSGVNPVQYPLYDFLDAVDAGSRGDRPIVYCLEHNTTADLGKMRAFLRRTAHAVPRPKVS